jgi:hypothetical protein
MFQFIFAIAAVAFFIYSDLNEKQASKYIIFCIIVFIIIRIFEGGSGDDDFYRRPGRG